MADPFDPEALRLTKGPPAASPAPGTPPRHRPGEKFLKGPIPLAWLSAAGRLPGKALLVGLAVWFEAGLRNRRAVAVNLARLAGPGLSDKTARRGLKALERAGLVAVDRPPGRRPVVTLLDPPPAAPAPGHPPGGEAA